MTHNRPQRRPELDEAAEFYWTYIRLVPPGDIVDLSKRQLFEIEQLLASVAEEEAVILHPPYSWTIKQLVGHLIDTERIFANRLHRFACGDLQAIPGMEQEPYIANCDYVNPPLVDLSAELLHCRLANTLLLQRLTPSAWDQRGVASGYAVTVRALAYMLVGHITYHAKIIRRRIDRNLPASATGLT
jgi:hypothetical protein